MSTAIDTAALSKPEFLAHWFQRVWTEEDASAIGQLMQPEAVVHGLGNVPSVGPGDFRAFQQGLLALIKDVKFTILETIENGTRLAGVWQLSATVRATGKAVASTGTVFADIREGRLAGGYNHFDIVGLYQDIGLLPPDTLPRLLAGQPLA